MSCFLTIFVLVGIFGTYKLWVALLSALSSWYLSVTGIFRICVCLLSLMATLRDIHTCVLLATTSFLINCKSYFCLSIGCEFFSVDHKCHSKLDPYLLLILLFGFCLYCLSLLISSSFGPLASSSNWHNLMLYIIFP